MKQEQSDSEEEQEDYASGSEESVQETKKRSRGIKGKLKKRQKGASRFIEDEASVSEDDEEKPDGKKKEDQFYKEYQIAQKNARLNLTEMEQRYQQGDEIDDDEMEPYGESDYGQEEQGEPSGKPPLPGIDDPRLWQVRVKKNFERVAVMALLNKCIDFARKG